MAEPQKSDLPEETEASRGIGLGTAIYVGALFALVFTVMVMSWTG